METTGKIWATLKNCPIGSIGGAVGGYYLAKKVIKTDKLIAIVPIMIVSALIGSSVEYKIKYPSGVPTQK